MPRQLPRAHLALQYIELSLAHLVAARLIVLQLNRVKADIHRSEPDGSECEASRRLHLGLLFPMFRPGAKGGSSGEDGHLPSRKRSSPVLKRGTGKHVISGGLQERRESVAELSVAHILQKDYIGVERL